MVKEIPLSALQIHPDHIPFPTIDDPDGQQLLRTVQDLGILQPLLVSETGPGTFLIIDGVRRYLCAKELGLEAVACLLKPPLKCGEYEIMRWHLHYPYRKYRRRSKTKATSSGG